MTKKELLEFAKINLATRNDPSNSFSKFKEIGYDIIRYFDINGAQGYLTKKGNILVLSFRGTQRYEKSDVLADFDIVKVKEGNGKVHRGFQTEANKLWEAVKEELKIHLKDNELFVVGHSLGAAIALIIASRLNEKVNTLVTMGSPRVGNSSFVKGVKLKHFRVQNTNDIVCWMPPLWMGFRHHGENLYIDYYGNLGKMGIFKKMKDMFFAYKRALEKKEYFSFWYDHRPSQYVKKLSD